MRAAAWETVIGLEVHVQLATKTKLFSRAENAHAGEPNTRVAPLDLGLPGTLPYPNARAVELAVRAALALDGAVQERSVFARKSYFYPDMSKGYQITQYEEPYCKGGRVPLGGGRFAQLERIHLEEDAGKSVHSGAHSLVDYNRAGVPLIEIVGQPDLREPADAKHFLTNLKQILEYAGISDCDMEKGSLRCDANISVRPFGVRALGTKVEIKNLNSIKMVQRALEYEAARQIATLAGQGTVRQETRLWSEEAQETSPLRSKESAQDYRYFPDPDLLPLALAPAFVDRIRGSLPELPAARRQRFAEAHGLPAYDVEVLTGRKDVADYFELVAKESGDSKAASNWVMGEVLRMLHEEGKTLDRFAVPPPHLAGLVRAIAAGKVAHAAAKKVFARMAQTGEAPLVALKALGLEQVTDAAAIEPIVREVIQKNPGAVADIQAGKLKALDALKGQVMRATKGKADPALVHELLTRLLGT